MSNKLLVSVREAASMLGISQRTIHRYASLGILHPVRVGRRKLLKLAELLAFAENGISVEALYKVKAGIADGK